MHASSPASVPTDALTGTAIGPAVFEAPGGAAALVAVLGEPDTKHVYGYTCAAALDRDWSWGDLTVGLAKDVVVNWDVQGSALPPGVQLPLGTAVGMPAAQVQAATGVAPALSTYGYWSINADHMEWILDGQNGSVTQIWAGTQVCD